MLRTESETKIVVQRKIVKCLNKSVQLLCVATGEWAELNGPRRKGRKKEGKNAVHGHLRATRSVYILAPCR